jgi:hypothetical protein
MNIAKSIIFLLLKILSFGELKKLEAVWRCAS